MNDKPWFVLYDGTSPDGRGGMYNANYVGRTLSVKKAKKFYKENIHNNPYSIGRVTVITPTKVDHIMNIDDFDNL